MAPKANRDLPTGPIGRNLLLFALPVMAGNIAQSLNGSINAVWVGRYLGESAPVSYTHLDVYKRQHLDALTALDARAQQVFFVQRTWGTQTLFLTVCQG